MFSQLDLVPRSLGFGVGKPVLVPAFRLLLWGSQREIRRKGEGALLCFLP